MFGLLFCKVSTFISHLAIAASVTTMLAIAIERFEMCTDDVALIINMITSILQVPGNLLSHEEDEVTHSLPGHPQHLDHQLPGGVPLPPLLHHRDIS